MRHQTLFGKALIFFAVLCFFTGCSRDEEEVIKVLHTVSGAKIKGHDPINADDLYSGNAVGRVYEGLLQYHYLERPYTLIPNLASEMPKVSDDGMTYTFMIKKGVFFHDSKCFKGGLGRELVAEDFVYSFKRMADTKNRGTGWWPIDGKIVGLNEWRQKNSTRDVTDYEEKVEGIQALGKYTLQFKLTRSYPQFLYVLAMPFFFAVSKEAVDYYGKEFLNYPVGTGPFILPRFKQSNKIVYLKNEKYRDQRYPTSEIDGKKNEDTGKKLPLVDKLIVHVMPESQPRWLNFLKGKLDFIAIPKDNFDSALNMGKELSPDMRKKGLGIEITPRLDITFVSINHDHPILGKNEKIRQAMSLAYDREELNKLFFNGTAKIAQSVIPPGLKGFKEGFVNEFNKHNIEKAKSLLAEAGYPNGKGLPKFTYDLPSSTINRQMGEYFRKSMAEIGIKIQVNTNTWPELQKKVKTRNNQLVGMAWSADYADAENFLQLFYGPNAAPGANQSNYNNDAFNSLYEKVAVMQDGKERTELYEKMNEFIAQKVPMLLGLHRQSFTLKQSWLKNHVFTEFESGNEKYWNIDLKLKSEMKKKL